MSVLSTSRKISALSQNVQSVKLLRWMQQPYKKGQLEWKFEEWTTDDTILRTTGIVIVTRLNFQASYSLELEIGSENGDIVLVDTSYSRFAKSFSMQQNSIKVKVGDLTATSDARLSEIAVTIIANLIRRPSQFLKRTPTRQRRVERGFFKVERLEGLYQPAD